MVQSSKRELLSRARGLLLRGLLSRGRELRGAGRPVSGFDWDWLVGAVTEGVLDRGRLLMGRLVASPPLSRAELRKGLLVWGAVADAVFLPLRLVLNAASSASGRTGVPVGRSWRLVGLLPRR